MTRRRGSGKPHCRAQPRVRNLPFCAKTNDSEHRICCELLEQQDGAAVGDVCIESVLEERTLEVSLRVTVKTNHSLHSANISMLSTDNHDLPFLAKPQKKEHGNERVFVYHSQHSSRQCPTCQAQGIQVLAAVKVHGRKQAAPASQY